MWTVNNPLRKLSALAGLSLLTSSAFAGMTGGAVSYNSLIEGGNVSRFAVGATADVQERVVVSPDGGEALMETVEPGVFVSLDAMRWFQLFATAGQSKFKLNDGEEGDYEFAWSVGGKISLWETSIPQNSVMHGNLRLFGSISYSDKGSGSISGASYDWEETNGSIALRLEKYKETFHSYPWAAYIGPTFSSVDVDVAGLGDVQEGEDTGFIAGIDVYFPNNVFFGYELRHFEESSHGFQLGVHF